MIICGKCGQELPDDVMFCYKCGTKVEKKKYCIKCGKELLEDAMFCMYCGTSVADVNDEALEKEKECPKEEKIEKETVADKGESLQDNSDNDVLSKIFDEFDPVVWHREYYGGFRTPDQPTSAFYNNEWILYSNESYPSNCQLRRIADDFQMEICIPSKDNDVILGFNNKGIWYGKTGSDDLIAKITLYDPVTETKESVSVDHLSINDSGLYIYDTEIYCIRETETRAKLITTDIYSQDKKTLLDLKKDDTGRLSRLSVGKEKIAVYDSGISEGGSWDLDQNEGWHVIDKMSGKDSFIGEAETGVRIYRIDMAKGIMWTDLFNQERWDANVSANNPQSENIILCRSFSYPEEGKYRIWKDSERAVVWDVPKDFIMHGGDTYYFDGSVMYCSKNPWEIIRFDYAGRKYCSLISEYSSGFRNPSFRRKECVPSICPNRYTSTTFIVFLLV